ncbi:hypothetical protein ACUXIS_005358, partial [Cytobacillus horneckiae]
VKLKMVIVCSTGTNFGRSHAENGHSLLNWNQSWPSQAENGHSLLNWNQFWT